MHMYSAKIAPGIQELKDAVTGKAEADHGPSLYDKESIRLQEERIANVDKEWSKLVKEVNAGTMLWVYTHTHIRTHKHTHTHTCARAHTHTHTPTWLGQI